MTSSPTEPRRYKVTSLERGLAVLRALRESPGPLRHQEISARTGLPKATVSRLMGTLGTLGYLRRTDQGSYVLRGQSARPGRAMVEGLRLERHWPLLRGLLVTTSGTVYLETQVGSVTAAVYRWTADEGTVLYAGSGETIDQSASVPVDLGDVGQFSLCFVAPRGAPMPPDHLADVQRTLLEVAHAIEREESA